MSRSPVAATLSVIKVICDVGAGRSKVTLAAVTPTTTPGHELPQPVAVPVSVRHCAVVGAALGDTLGAPLGDALGETLGDAVGVSVQRRVQS